LAESEAGLEMFPSETGLDLRWDGRVSMHINHIDVAQECSAVFLLLRRGTEPKRAFTDVPPYHQRFDPCITGTDSFQLGHGATLAEWSDGRRGEVR
jgi:hypothetical protein